MGRLGTGAKPLIVGALCAWLAGCGQDDARTRIDNRRAALATSSTQAAAGWLRIRTGRAESAWLGDLLASDQPFRISRTRIGDLTLCTHGRCELSARVQSASLLASPTPQARERLAISVSVQATSGPVPVRFEQTWPCALTARPECTVSVDSSTVAPATLNATATFIPTVDERTGLTGLMIDEVRVPVGLDPGDLIIEGSNACGQLWCSMANVAGVGSLLTERANESVRASLSATLETLACRVCSRTCPDGSECVAGLCRTRAGCVPAPLAKWIALGETGRESVRLAAALGDAVRVEEGVVDFAIRLSADPLRRDACAPAAREPRPVQLPREVLAGTLRADARLALGAVAMSRAAWAMHQSGMGCLDLALDEVPALAFLNLERILPASERLESLGTGAPVLSARVLGPPEVRIADDGGVHLNAVVQMDIEAQVDGRLLRLASGNLDVSAAFGLLHGRQGLALGLRGDGAQAEVRQVWTAPVLAAEQEALRRTFTALATIAVQLVPAEIPLGDLGAIRLAGPARGVGEGAGRALVVDLHFGGPR